MSKMGRPKNPPKPKSLLKELLPLNEMFDEDEQKIYEGLVDIYLNDFEEDELTAMDLDDVLGLATNKVLEIRLMKTSMGSTDKQVDVSSAIEKIRKQNKEFKQNLLARRSDRINPNEFKGFSIVDLAVAFDDGKKFRLEERIRKLKDEEEEVKKDLCRYEGNRYDMDDVKESTDDK